MTTAIKLRPVLAQMFYLRWLAHIGWLILKSKIRQTFPQVQQISTEELANWLDRSEATKPLLLDTRQPEEYAVSYLPDAQRLDPYTSDFAELEAVPHDRPIVTYCSVGYRSARVADRLQSAGYTNVANLEGSIFEWANKGRSVYRDGAQVKQVHPYNTLWGYLLHPELRADKPQ